MKKIIVLIFIVLATTMSIFTFLNPKSEVFAEEQKPKLAIVIDDFGADRHGVEEMLDIPLPLTIAVMPSCEFSEEDANKAFEKGHEVILHMPMQNQSNSTPLSYYGPVFIKNNFTPSEATSTIKSSIESIPHCKGVNIHMGTGVSQNERLITPIMEEVARQNLYFLDSKTIENSVCPKCAEKTGVDFFVRDVFLEPSGSPSYAVAINQLNLAINLAKEKGSAIAIGHVGPVGKEETAKAILNSIDRLNTEGIEVVPLSELIKN